MSQLNRNILLKELFEYKEILYYLEGKISLDEAVNMIKQGSRNYAKRQLTFMKTIKDLKIVGTIYDDYIKELRKNEELP